ncbi:zinc finger protein OZF-like [Culicoides brevitarsis]|uniref:zinc finger protein OZF-like n=1 Tax=Culicoides brevitarsis TaxID=469753 RepID=UPI00307B91D8
MTIQDVNVFLDIDFLTKQVREARIVEKPVGLSKIFVDFGENLVGKCSSCTNNFQICIYGTPNSPVTTEFDEILEPTIVKIEENDTFKLFFDESQEESVPTKNQETLEEPENKNWECKFCGKGLKNVQGLAMHEKFCKINRNRQEKKSSKGNAVEKKAENVEIKEKTDELKEKDTISKRKFACKYCQRVFKRFSIARRHEQTLHERQINFTCETCGWGTWCERELELHKIKVHTGNPRPFICDICTTRNTFPSKATVVYHMRVHHIKDAKFKCDTCRKRFTCKTHLGQHIQTVHSSLRPFPCPDCGKLFKQQSDVKIHRYKIHVPKERKPQIMCNVCDFVTHDKHSFARHKLLHLDDAEKPFHCKFCGKGFPSKSNQERHEKTHLDIRPFTCSFCEKAFRTKEDLKIHVRHHTGEKPYECEVCGQRYGDRGCYRSHLIGHEKQMGITLDKSVKKFLNKPKVVDDL